MIEGKEYKLAGVGIERWLKIIYEIIQFKYPNPDKPEKILQFLHISSTIKKNVGGCVHVTYR